MDHLCSVGRDDFFWGDWRFSLVAGRHSRLLGCDVVSLGKYFLHLEGHSACVIGVS